MATNIAAIPYIGRRVDRPGLVLVAGLLYALGRTIAYVVLAILLLKRRPVGVANIYLP